MKSFKIILVCIAIIAFLSFASKGFLSPETSGEEDILKKMRVTLERSILGERGEPRVLQALAEKGVVIIFDESTEGIPWLTSAGTLIDAPPEEVWQVVSDFKHWPEFMPTMKSAKIVDKGHNVIEIEWRLLTWISVIPFSMRYSERFLLQPPKRADWIGIGGDMKSNYGFWELIPVEGGTKTIVFCSLYSEPKSWLLNSIMKRDPFLKKAVSFLFPVVIIKSLKERVMALQKQKKVNRGEQTKSEKITDEETFPSKDYLLYPGWEWLPLKTVEVLSTKGALIIAEEEKGSLSITAANIIDAPPNMVFANLADYESYPIFIKMMDKVKVVKTEGNTAFVDYVVDFPYFVFRKKLHYTLEQHSYPPQEITQTLVKGDIKEFTGSWELLPLEGGRRTLTLFKFHSDLRSVGFLMNFVLKKHPELELAIQSATGLMFVKSIKDRVEGSLSNRKRNQ